MAALQAISAAGTRKEETHVIVNLSCSGHGRARVPRGIFLFNGDGGRDTGDFVDIGFFDTLETLPGICVERLDVAALPFGVDGVKCQARLPGTADTEIGQ